MFRGRRVTEPTPIIRSMPYAADPSNPKLSDLENVWDDLGKAKQAMRRTEHRIDDSLRPLVPLNRDPSPIPHRDNVVPVDRIPRYQVGQSSQSGVGDGGAKDYTTRRVKSARKISRHVDYKYKPRSPLRETNLQEYKNRSPRRVEFKEHPEYREIQDHLDTYKTEKDGILSKPAYNYSYPSESTYSVPAKYDVGSSVDRSRYDAGGYDAGYKKHSTYSLDNLHTTTSYSSRLTDLTDSRALRETDIRFLNDNMTSTPDTSNRGASYAPRLHHVDVTVPQVIAGASKGYSTTTMANPSTGSEERLSDGNTTFVSSSGHSITSYSDGQQSRKARKIHKGLKKLDKDSDALSKLREKIKEQRLRSTDTSLASSDDNSANQQPSVPMDTSDIGQRNLHHENETVARKAYDLPVPEKDASEPILRKVAMAPPPPRYQGFSEVETKIRTPDGKLHYMSQVRKEHAHRRHERQRLKQKLSGKDTGNQEGSVDTHKTSKVKPQKSVTPKKTARVTGKVHKKDLITVRSWRAGQKVVSKELGPKRVMKVNDPAPVKDGDHTDTSESAAESKSDRKPLEETREEFLDSLEPTKAKVLSEEAKNVLADLKSESEDEEEPVKDNADSKKKSKPATKRKAPKIEPEKNFPVAKVRHYDHDDVRKYMLQKQAERKKKLAEEKNAKKHAEEEKRQKLQQLYKKQKGTGGGGSKRKEPKLMNETFMKEEPIALPRRHPFQEDKIDSTVDEKEESDSSTLTGDSVDEHTPHASDREDEASNRKHIVPLDVSTSDDDSLSVDELINKYSKNLPKVAELGKKSSADISPQPAAISTSTTTSIPFTYGVSSSVIAPTYPTSAATYTNPAQYYYSSTPATSVGQLAPSMTSTFNQPTDRYSSTIDAHRSKLDRIKAIKETAKSLESKIQVETRRLVRDDGSTSVALPTVASDRWAVPSYRTPIYEEEDDGVVTRQERLTGGNDDYTVYSTDLPGVGNLDRLAQLSHSRRRDTLDRGPESPDRRLGLVDRRPDVRHQFFSDEAHRQYLNESETDDSMQDSTLTDISETRGPTKVGAGLMTSDYCVGTSKGKGFHRDLSSPVHLDLDPQPYPEMEGDPHSVINIYLRRQKAERERKAAEEYLASKDEALSPGYEDDFTDFSEDSRKLSRPEEGDTVAATEASFHKPASYTQSHSVTLSRGDTLSHSGRQSQSSKLKSASHHTEDDITLDMRSMASGDREDPNLNQNSSPSRHVSANKSLSSHCVASPPGKTSPPGRSYVDRSREHDDSLESDLSSLGEDVTPYDPVRDVSTALSHPSLPRAAELRMSPHALQLHLSTELNRMENADLSMMQLADIERTRGIAFAQQESVSLAQILKGRQQQHEREMQMLQMKARQESFEASRQLELTRQRAADAAQQAQETMASVRHQNNAAFQESTRRLLESQADAAKATANAAQQLAQAKEASVHQTEAMRMQDATKMATETATAAATAAVQASMEQLRVHPTWWTQKQAGSRGQSLKSESAPTGYSETFDSYSSYSKSKSLATTVTEDKKPPRSSVQSDASISTESVRTQSIKDASSHPQSDHTDKSQSITEDILTDKVSDADYSQQFDDTMSEDEIEEHSFRMVLPSETHRRRAKQDEVTSDHASYSSDDTHHTGVSKLHMSDISSPFIGEESFSKFTADMVKQFVREEEIRAQHQASLLKLREKALKEKTRAEMTWLEQQKKRIQKKGADDTYPQIKKKQRGLLMRLKQEQAEIKRLQESNRIAAEKRKLLLLQQEQINQLRQSTLQTKEKLQSSKGAREEAVDTDDEISSRLDDLVDSATPTPRSKEYKSDSEVCTEMSIPQSASLKSASDVAVFNKLKKFKFDKKFLTLREQKLQERRKQAEQLLEWKKRLDREEEEIYQMEKAALSVWEKGKKSKGGGDGIKKKEAETPNKRETKSEKPPPKNLKAKNETMTESHGDSINTTKSITEDITSSAKERGHLRSGSDSSISEDMVQCKSDRGHQHSGSESSVPEDIPSAASDKGHRHSGSESSIAEDVPDVSQSRSSSIADEVPSKSLEKKTDSNDTITSFNQSISGDYSVDTFEPSSAATRKSSPPSKSSKVSARSLLSQDASLSPRSLKSPRSPFYPRRRGSESESEDSFSQTHSETASDQSDAEGKIRALAEQLKRRKIEAERLKKEHKKRQKDRMKAKEVSLLKQIEAYDNVISQVKADLQNELEHKPNKSGVKPQIKQPCVAESKRLKKAQEQFAAKETTTTTPSTVNKQRTESESSKSSQSSFDEVKDGPESYSSFSQPASPALDDTLRVLPTPSPMRSETDARPRSLASITEATSSPSASIKKPNISSAHSISEDISEKIPSASESIKTASQRSESHRDVRSGSVRSHSESIRTASQQSKANEKDVSENLPTYSESIKSAVEPAAQSVSKTDEKSDNGDVSENIPSYSDSFNSSVESVKSAADSIKSALPTPTSKSVSVSKSAQPEKSVADSVKLASEKSKSGDKSGHVEISENVLNYSDSFNSSAKSNAESIKSALLSPTGKSAGVTITASEEKPPPASARSIVSEGSIPEDISEHVSDHVSEHSEPELKDELLDTGRSLKSLSIGQEVKGDSEINEEFQDDFESEGDASVKSVASDRSSHKSFHSEDSRHSAKSFISEKSQHSIKSHHSAKSGRSERSDRSVFSRSRSVSEKSDDSHTLTERSAKSGSDYTEDFSNSETSYSSRHSKKSAVETESEKSVKKQLSEKSAKKEPSEKSSKKHALEKSQSIEESIASEDEVSEQLSYHSESSERSLNVLDLTGEIKPQDDREKTPVISPQEPDHLQTINIGDRVIISGTQPGTLKFKGKVSFASGFWTGISLDDSEGTNDGTKDGVKYFECPQKHGIFAPPDKVELYEGSVVSEKSLEEEILSEKTDHTLTNADDEFEKKEDGDNDGYKDELSNVDDKSEKLEETSIVGKERSESVIDEVSIATDSELDRVISSAALAVEEFGRSTPDDVLSTTTTPRVDTARSEQVETPVVKGLTLEEHVDKITDSLTSMVIKDSLDMVASIAIKKSETKPVDTVADSAIPKVIRDKTSFLDLLARSESGQEDSIDNEVPEELSFEGADISEKVSVEPSSVKEAAIPGDEPSKVDKVGSTTDSVVQTLLTSTIDNLISLRKHQRQKLSESAEETDGGAPSPPRSPLSVGSPPSTPYTPDSDKEDHFNDSLPLSDDMFENRIQIEVADTPLPRPVSPVMGEPSTPIPDDNMDFNSGDIFSDNFNDQWMDDDFGLSRKIPNKPPPPYPGTQSDQPVVGEVSKLDLQKLTEELFYAIPHKRDEVLQLANKTIDHYWNLRRYGETWEDVKPPADYFTSDDTGNGDIENTSRRVYKQLVFQLTGEIIEDMYKDEEEVEPQPWCKPKYVQRKYIKGKTPPTTVDALKEIVEKHISHLVSSTVKPRRSKSGRVAGRKKKDQVDGILVQELREEEPMWVDYSVDEMAVKIQLSDAIFDSLVVETGNVINEILAKRS